MPRTSRPDWLQLHRAYSALFKLQESVLLPTGVTLPQLDVMYLLREAGDGVPLHALAEQLMRESQSMTTLVDRMEAKGWVQRLGHPRDRRQKLVSLTEAGASKLDEAQAVIRSLRRRAFSSLPEEDLKSFRASVDRLLRFAIEELGG